MAAVSLLLALLAAVLLAQEARAAELDEGEAGDEESDDRPRRYMPLRVRCAPPCACCGSGLTGPAQEARRWLRAYARLRRGTGPGREAEAERVLQAFTPLALDVQLRLLDVASVDVRDLADYYFLAGFFSAVLRDLPPDRYRRSQASLLWLTCSPVGPGWSTSWMRCRIS